MADQLYDAQQNNPKTEKNGDAAGAGGDKVPYCVDGAILYCTMGSARSQLRVDDHGLKLTGLPAAHDGDTAPNKNIFPFGCCKLKDNKPCNPAPVGRWLLADEYAVIGSCYAAKQEQFAQSCELMGKARMALEPLCTSVFALPIKDMPQIEPMLRNAIYQASRALRYEQERLTMLCMRTFTDTGEATDYLEIMQSCTQSAKVAMDAIALVFAGQEKRMQLLRDQYTTALQAINENKRTAKIQGLMRIRDNYDALLQNTKGKALDGLRYADRLNYQKILADIGTHAEESTKILQQLVEAGHAIVDQESADQGCQITTNSIIPCQIGGLIYV